MEFINEMENFVTHFDKYLAEIIQNYGVWTYYILFLMVFCETGLVIAPFLPGDSLLFIVGTFSANNTLEFKLAAVVLMIAAITGDTLNYFIGRLIGDRIIENQRFQMINRIVKKKHIDRAQAFYQKHGGKAIILSRFFPILRTFIPFVAGIGKMNFTKFMMYNPVGGVTWVLVLMLGW